MKPYLKRAWAEVSLPQLRKNVDIIRSLNSPTTDIMAVVKADAYGHGDEHIVRCLAEQCGIKYFAVSNLDEAIAVRKFAPDADILILGYTPPEYAHEIEDRLMDMGIRTVADYADVNMNTKIKTFKTMKDPYIVVVGDKERDEHTVSITIRGEKQQLHGVPLEKFFEMCERMNREHSRELITTAE